MFKKILKNYYVFQAIIAILFAFLAIALWFMQIQKGSYWQQIAENNFVRKKKVKPVRGRIFDSKYRAIATNSPAINLYYSPYKIKNKQKLITFLAKTLHETEENLAKFLKENRWRYWQEIQLATNMTPEEYVPIAEQLDQFPELSIVNETIRNYKINNHFIGYLSKITPKMWDKYQKMGYSKNELIGITGLEKTYQNILRGEQGYKVKQVDARGKNLGFFEHNLEKPVKNGSDIILHLDLELQKYIKSVFPENSSGAVVVMDVTTGGILAYASFPDYNTNIFNKAIPTAVWDSLTTNPLKPLLDRAAKAAYPPGSVFKPVTASFGLEEKIVNRYTRLANCDGGMQLGNRYFKCWNKHGHGKTNLYESMIHSCDVYYYDLSQRLDLDRFRTFTAQNGFLYKTGIDIEGERIGFFPDKNWFVKNYGRYYSVKGQLANLSIGQGEVLTTPLQVTAYYAALANDGIWIKPRFFDKSIGNTVLSYADIFSEETRVLPISKKNLSIIQHSLYGTVNDPKGTGKPAKVKGVKVYGKTGSAENHKGDLTHAWFSGWAKTENAKIAYTVFIENIGHGGSYAAPIAGKIINYYYNQIKKNKSL